MGGFFRAITRIFRQPVQQPAQVMTVQAPAATTVSGSQKVSKLRGQGSGVTGTIMTDATGIEEEANVSKAILGGATTKKKKYKV